MRFDKDEIKNSLTIEQVEQFLAEHGGEPVKRIGTLVSRTICHNPADGNGSHKLYYYENTHLFKCYTGCAETGGFDIFDLTRKIMKIQSNIEMSLYDAQIYIINFFLVNTHSYFIFRPYKTINMKFIYIRNCFIISDFLICMIFIV